MTRTLFLAWVIALGAAGSMQAQNSSPNTVITSDSLNFDYRRYVAVFEGNVVVQDPEVRIQSDRLNVRFDKENSLKWVTAIGKVRLTYTDKIATCDKAVYMQSTGEVVLMGNARLGRGDKDSVSCDKITFWLNEDRMVCEGGKGSDNRPTLVIFPDDKSGGNALDQLGFGDKTDARKSSGSRSVDARSSTTKPEKR